MANKLEKTLLYAVSLAVIFLLAIWLWSLSPKAFSSAPSGLPATITDFKEVSVGPSLGGETILTHTSPNCVSRIISTGVNAVMLRFSSSTVSNGVATSVPKVSGNFGHLQLASTTVAYDGGIYGCGGISAFGFTSTTSVYFTELK